MKTILYLVHRIPYPPNKGDKIRSFHLLQYLTRHYRVFLGAFVDDQDDWQHVNTLEDQCEGVFLRNLIPYRAKIKSLTALLGGDALTLPYYRDSAMQSWVDKVLSTQPVDSVVVFSSAMAQYVMAHEHKRYRRIIDFVDVDSDKWRQYSEKKQWPMSWLYGREGRCLLRFEQKVAHEFDKSLFVSDSEAQHFLTLAPQSGDKVGYFNNGVDADYFSPEHEYKTPYTSGENVLVFTGSMDYWANIEAVIWFVKDVFPLIKSAVPDACFYIVGANPSDSVSRLAMIDGVYVTGRVDDVRPYIAYATAAVAPLRIARGIQNKVLEAMAMAKPVLTTTVAMEGIVACAGKDLVVADDAAEMAEAAVKLLRSQGEVVNTMGQAARHFVLEQYSWSASLEYVGSLIENTIHGSDKQNTISQPNANVL